MYDKEINVNAKQLDKLYNQYLKEKIDPVLKKYNKEMARLTQEQLVLKVKIFLNKASKYAKLKDDVKEIKRLLEEVSNVA